MKKIKLAIVGATGLVGKTVLDILKEQNLLFEIEIVLFASKTSAGKRMLVAGNEYKIFEPNEDFENMEIDYAIFSAGGSVSKEWVRRFCDAGVVVIDNTSVFRMNQCVPLIVPEINISEIKSYDKLIANPNCSTIQLAVVLDKLRKINDIEQVVVSTYQSVSGAGRRALNDLINSSKNYFKSGIKNNIIAGIGDFDKKGFCAEETKLMTETGKILKDKKMRVCATAVRVPISVCHGESVYIKCKNNIKLTDVFKVLKCDYIEVLNGGVCLPTEVKGSNKTFVCRVRKVSKNEIAMFIIADNLRRGAAYNAVEILKYLIKNRGVRA